MSIEIFNKVSADVDEAKFSRLLGFALDYLHVHPDSDVSLSFVSTAEMEQLHIKWLDLPGATDVMSFPMDELIPGDSDDALSGPGILGDIVVCPEFASAQAVASKNLPEREMLLLVVHGLLHLLGYDHMDEDDRLDMFELQTEILVSFLLLESSAESANV